MQTIQDFPWNDVFFIRLLTGSFSPPFQIKNVIRQAEVYRLEIPYPYSDKEDRILL